MPLHLALLPSAIQFINDPAWPIELATKVPLCVKLCLPILQYIAARHCFIRVTFWPNTTRKKRMNATAKTDGTTNKHLHLSKGVHCACVCCMLWAHISRQRSKLGKIRLNRLVNFYHPHPRPRCLFLMLWFSLAVGGKILKPLCLRYPYYSSQYCVVNTPVPP